MDAIGALSILDPASDDGFPSGVRAEQVLEPVPYACPACRRTLLDADG